MSFRMPSIYPYWVWVARPAESAMTERENPDADVAPNVSEGGGHDHASHDDPAAGAKVRDPVCGMSVDPATSRHRFDFSGESYHFCCAGCRNKFAADPQNTSTSASRSKPHRRARST